MRALRFKTRISIYRMCTTSRFHFISLEIRFIHSPDHNTFGLLQYQLQLQHEKCHLRSSIALLSSVSYYHFTSANESAQVYSKLRDIFNSDKIKFITRHDGFMLNTSQLIINNTGQQNLTFFLALEEKYLILIELLTLNSNV